MACLKAEIPDVHPSLPGVASVCRLCVGFGRFQSWLNPETPETSFESPLKARRLDKLDTVALQKEPGGGEKAWGTVLYGYVVYVSICTREGRESERARGERERERLRERESERLFDF